MEREVQKKIPKYYYSDPKRECSGVSVFLGGIPRQGRRVH